MQEIGKVMVMLGVAIAIIGALLWKTGSLGPLGQLPGDITWRSGNSTFYFPIVTCLLLSLLLTLVSWLFRR